MRILEQVTACCIALIGASTPAFAAGFYVGVDAGISRAKGDFSGDLQTLSVGERRSDSAEGARIRFGWRASRFFAMEVGYVDLGDFSYRFDPNDCPPLFQGNCDFTTRTSVSGPLTNAVVMLPLDDRWSLNARLGWIFLQVKARESGPDASTNRAGTDTEGGLLYSGGVTFRATDKLDIDLGWTRFEEVSFGVTLGGDAAAFSQGAASLTSIGVSYRF